MVFIILVLVYLSLSNFYTLNQRKMKTYQSLFPKCLWSGRLLSFSRLSKHFSSHHCKSITDRNTASRDSIIFSVKTEKHLTAFESSFVGHICGKHKKEDDTTVRKDLRLTMKDNEFYEIEKETPPLKDSILRNGYGIDCACPFFKNWMPSGHSRKNIFTQTKIYWGLALDRGWGLIRVRSRFGMEWNKNEIRMMVQ